MVPRLDREVTERGLARSRTVAAVRIKEGRVRVNGAVAVKPSALVDSADEIALEASTEDEYVSRAGHKLVGALERFADVDPTGLRCLDAGASTGGFTDVLLRRGAREVLAVDVGHDQLVPQLREDPRVRVFEGLNVRHLDPVQIGGPADLTVCDLSFISLTLVLPALAGATLPGGDLLLMVKPQFEVGVHNLSRTGVVTSEAAREAAVLRVTACAEDTGLEVLGTAPSPLPGQDGNVEFFVHCRRPGAPSTSEGSRSLG
ncbi:MULTISPECIES: TlyA family RNA methyltransferase [unclassified Kocuria]|uniref:TlyA family RNA methyltransferase n=1 Tax=unclassified Kocuria TaxID=2649579 RepID=UPI000F871FE3|nr:MULTISPECIES: TlyA family RNA methyltransferase [unclassified Kocuria]RUP82027.1 TlyA family RNA methyltransferase [Kocuria sp. HSID17590]RUQ11425.1 TlyA family RNA methyltransferase [Kocuria sp. HSID17582]